MNERARLIAEGLRINAVKSFYEAHPEDERARLQEIADRQAWETEPCHACGGSGREHIAAENAFDDCIRCNGTGRRYTLS